MLSTGPSRLRTNKGYDFLLQYLGSTPCGPQGTSQAVEPFLEGRAPEEVLGSTGHSPGGALLPHGFVPDLGGLPEAAGMWAVPASPWQSAWQPPAPGIISVRTRKVLGRACRRVLCPQDLEGPGGA